MLYHKAIWWGSCCEAMTLVYVVMLWYVVKIWGGYATALGYGMRLWYDDMLRGDIV